MKKLTKPEDVYENLLKALKEAREALRNGLGPAHNSDKTFTAIPGDIKGNVYYALIVEKGENGNKSKPVDLYSWSPKPGFVSGFGGWYKYGYDELIKANPWVELAM